MSTKIIKDRAALCDVIFGEPADATDEHLSRIVYKSTACGGWMQSIDGGVKIGTIVEGSDAEFMDTLYYPFTEAEWDAAWNEIEHLAEEEWKRANEPEEDL